MERLAGWIREWGVWGAAILIGLACLGYGLWGQLAPTEPDVKIISGQNLDTPSGQSGTVWVDVGGAVQKANVYQLPAGARIGDALVAAGGLSSEADREWVAETLNLAQPLDDGQKIYIPARRETEFPEERESVTSGTEAMGSQKINLNAATQAELESLRGIGEARAAAIVAGRPYAQTDEIIEKAKIPQSVYDDIKDQISVY